MFEEIKALINEQNERLELLNEKIIDIIKEEVRDYLSKYADEIKAPEKLEFKDTTFVSLNSFNKLERELKDLKEIIEKLDVEKIGNDEIVKEKVISKENNNLENRDENNDDGVFSYLINRMEIIEKKYKKLDERIDEKIKKLNDDPKDNKLNQKIEILEKKIDDISKNRENIELNQKIEVLEKKIDDTLTENDKLNQKIEVLENKIDDISKNRENLEKQTNKSEMLEKKLISFEKMLLELSHKNKTDLKSETEFETKEVKPKVVKPKEIKSKDGKKIINIYL